MAIFHLSVKSISRASGHSAVAAAAYRSRDALYDARTGRVHDYSRMQNAAVFTGIFVPQDAPAWAQDRNQLWNAAEKAETDYNRKKNAARVAQDITIALPHEMTDQQREWLVKDFARAFSRRGYAVDVAVHEPHKDGDQRNHHAHILISERTINHDGFAPTKDRSLKDKTLLDKWREDFALLTNRHLERHGLAARVDHRSFKEQGIADRTPGIHVGKDATAAERKGRRTERGERAEAIQARNAERQQIRVDLHMIEQEQRRYERPTNATAALIHDARFASDGGKAFVAALAEHGLALAQAQADDLATVNAQRPADWRPVEAGAYVVVTQRGSLYELTERNTGLTRADRAVWLQELDGTLAGITATQAAIAAAREAQRQARRDARLPLVPDHEAPRGDASTGAPPAFQPQHFHLPPLAPEQEAAMQRLLDEQARRQSQEREAARRSRDRERERER